jgi:hypothetical protein
MKQMKNSTFFSLTHHLSYKPRYSSPTLPLHLTCWWLPSSRFYLPFLCHPSILHPWSSLFFHTQRSAHYQALLHTQSLNPSMIIPGPSALVERWKLLVGKGEDWLYGAGELRAAHRFSAPFPELVFSVFYVYSDRFVFLSLVVTFHSFCHLPY